MGKQLVLVGGGHAHMVTLANISRFIEKGHQVTVIGPSDYHYYSGMGPGMLGMTYSPEDIRFATRHTVEKQGGKFIKDKVVRIDPDKRIIFLESKETVSYDVLSFNAGSFVPRNLISGSDDLIFSVKPIERLMTAQEKLRDMMAKGKKIISIVGGGPSSAEIAGNVWQLARRINSPMPEIRIFAGKKFMSRFPDQVRLKIIAMLEKRGITLYENGYVKEMDNGGIRLETGDKFKTDFIFLATGVTPSPIFKESGLPMGPDNGLEVNTYLQCTAYPEIFGGGDCIYFKDAPLDKVGVYAVRQNPVLYHNLMAALEQAPLEPFDPGPDYLLIFNVGGAKGVLKKSRLVFSGTLAFKIKDFIDMRFMKKFQDMEKAL